MSAFAPTSSVRFAAVVRLQDLLAQPVDVLADLVFDGMLAEELPVPAGR